MAKKHLSRLAAPNTWPIERKKTKWIAKPSPGPHNLNFSMPLNVWLCEVLKLAKTKAEIKKILNQKEILVNNKTVKDLRYPLGLFDVLSIPKIKTAYRIIISKNNKLKAINCPPSEIDYTLAKVIKKTTVKKGRCQITLSNGWTFLANPKEYLIGDSVLINLKKKEFKSLPLEIGALAYIVQGSNTAKIGKIVAFSEEGLLRKKKYVHIQTDSETFKVLKDHIYIIGKDKPIITLET
ncbi:MAG: 30S ribosomal protein S4e [Candidatus Nanoarchaeia archaeon]